MTVKAARTSPWKKLAEKLIVERTRLSESKWLPHFIRLKRYFDQYDGVLANPGEPQKNGLDPRELLLWAWLTLMSAPENKAQLYAQLRERKNDGKGIEDEAANLRDRNYKFKGLETSPQLQIAWLAALVRAIDGDLASVNYWHEPGTAFAPKAWQVEGYPCYIVPVQRSHRLEDGKQRGRRATHYHAIVPERFADYTIDLKLHSEVSAAAEPREWSYGAAILTGMTIDLEFEGDQFHVASAPLANDAPFLEDQVDEALAASVDALVWPELTVPDSRLKTIRDKLGADPLRDPRRIPLVLAGSWHREGGNGQRVNRAVLLQSRGEELTYYDKRRIYEVNKRYEAIEPGSVIPVIVMEDRLVGIAICKDFCDDCSDSVYEALSLDLVLVPSMGLVSTTKAHARSAKALQSQQGTVCVMVQQVPVETGQPAPPNEPPGYSFASPPREAPHPPPSSEQSTPFRKLQARR